MTLSVTPLWLLPAEPLRWVERPTDIEDWRSLGPFYWERYVDLQSERGKVDLDKVIPPLRKEQYPRLVRNPELGASYAGRKARHGLYAELARVVPPLMGDEARLEVSLAEIKQSADDFGMLFHPRYGDSAYGWVVTSLQFQILQSHAGRSCSNSIQSILC